MTPENSELPALDASLVRAAATPASGDVIPAPPALLDLPERAVQFGTGAFLRGFVDYFVDAANRAGKFNGRVVVIGSTGSGRDQAINEQDGLYTLAVQGIENGEPKRELRVISSVSRAISASDDWRGVLACARNPWLEVVFSNTTEVGIELDERDAFDAAPPPSFPAKLTRFLYERARSFAFSRDKGVVVVPCELIEDNGDRLRALVLELAERWELGPAFARWIGDSVPFCNTLVDRIVPGAPPAAARAEIEGTLGYRDAMLTSCETYRLFAVEMRAASATRLPFLARGPVAAEPGADSSPRLSFADADRGIVLTDDVRPYRERKVRLLNGTHTIMVPAALLAGCETVQEAVEHEQIGRFVRRAMLDEIVPTVEAPDAAGFAAEVLERFANPYIRHALFDITLHGTAKMRVRVVPSIVRYAARNASAPAALAFGFAAYLELMRGELQEARRAAGLPVPADVPGERVRAAWVETRADADANRIEALVERVCSDQSLWGTDLTRAAGFAAAVADHLARIRRDGIAAALDALLAGAAVHAA